MSPIHSVALSLFLFANATPETTREPDAYMRKVGFSDAELADMEAGKGVCRVLIEKDDNDASIVGVVKINARPEALVDGIRRIETFKKGELVLQVGRFGAPPRFEDLRTLSFDGQDLDDLSKCKVGDCDVQVPISVMEVAKKVDWKAPDASLRATELVKQAIVQLVEAYLERGSSAMAVYNNNDTPESVAAEFAKILQNSPNLARYNPELFQYLLDFPKGAPPNTETFLYWSKERVRRPVISVAQVFIHKVNQGAGTGYYIAIKHIYNSHYFLANTEFLTLVPTQGAKGFYLVHAMRARIDPPRKLRGLLLGKIKGAMKDLLAADLKRTKLQLEVAGGSNR